MNREVVIPSNNVSSFTSRILKLNKRAVKLGITPIVIETIGTELVEIKDADRYKPYFIEYTTLNVIGEDPVLSGHRLIASIDHDPELGVMINVVPGLELPVSFRESNGSCDHCKAKRFRKKTVVIQHVETGNYLEVGRSCLKDFLSSDRIDRYTWLESFTSTLDSAVNEFADTSAKDFRFSPIHNLQHVLACAIKDIEKNGYVSSSYAKEQWEAGRTDVFSTASKMWLLLYGDKYHDIYPYEPTAEELAEAKNIIEWGVDNITPSNDYFYNVLNILKACVVRDKYMAFAVSIIPLYRRMFAEKKEKIEKKPSEYIGTVGKREVFKLRYVNEVTFSSYYGNTTVYIFREGENNKVAWISLNRESFQPGEEITVKATVKKHEIYRDEKQTSLSRVKVIGLP